MNASDAKMSNIVGLIGLTYSSEFDEDPDAILFAILCFRWLMRNFWQHLRTVRLFNGGPASALLIFFAACCGPDCSEKEKNIYWLTLMVRLLRLAASTLMVIWSNPEIINMPSAPSRGLYKNKNYLIRSRTFNLQQPNASF